MVGTTGLAEDDLVRLYERLERPLYNVAYRYVWSAIDARDVVQEAFLKLWRIRRRVRLDTVEPLLFRIAINTATSLLRRRRVWRWLPLISPDERASDDPGPEHVFLASREHERMRRALESLPSDLREVVVLCELSEMSYTEVAETPDARHRMALERVRLETDRVVFYYMAVLPVEPETTIDD